MSSSVRLANPSVACPLCSYPCASKDELAAHLDSCVASSVQLGMARGAGRDVDAQLDARRAEVMGQSGYLRRGAGADVRGSHVQGPRGVLQPHSPYPSGTGPESPLTPGAGHASAYDPL